MTFTNRNITLGVYFDGDISSGGACQQCLRAIRQIREVKLRDCSIKYVVSNKKSFKFLEGMGIDSLYLEDSWRQKILHGIFNFFRHPRLSRTANYLGLINPYDYFFIKHHIDLVYFLGPFNLASKIQITNYIFTIWDFAHREYPEFPEVRKFYEFEIRESLYNQVLRRATAVVVESAVSKNNAINYYGVDPKRIFIAPLSCYSIPKVVDKKIVDLTLAKFHIEGDYIYYPAQYWAHKNHAYILYSLRRLLDAGMIDVKVVFSGSDKGNLFFLQELVTSLGLEKNVIFCGFVDEHDLFALYSGSLALVMPTYFGPTNLPPLEAFSLGVPVIYPEKLSKEQQIESAVIGIDLDDPATLSDAIACLKNDLALRNSLTKEGNEIIDRSLKSNPYVLLNAILDDYRPKLNSWKLAPPTR